MSPGSLLFLLAGMLAALPALLARCFFLAPYRVGAGFYLANIWKETLARRVGIHPSVGDLVPLAAAMALCALAGGAGPFVGGALVALVLLLELFVKAREGRILTTSWSFADPRWRPPGDGHARLPAGAAPHPTFHPLLVVNVDGPFVSRTPRYDLGALAEGRTLIVSVLVGNHSVVPAQVPVEIRLSAAGSVEAHMAGDSSASPPRPGEVRVFAVEVSARRAGGTGRIGLEVVCGAFRQEVVIGVRRVFAHSAVASARVTRYPGARRAAFAWRGDMDHYDTVTFQSIEGLRTTLSLGARYRFPQTLFLSTRLTLDAEEVTRFYRHFGAARGAEEIAAFVAWMRDCVDIRYSAPYPFESSRQFLLELGNHMHLHYGTDAAAAEENDWQRGAGMGQGTYAWSSPGADAYTEQRDNAREAARRMEAAFGVGPRSWAMPDSTKDAATPRAVEAAGCEVLSDSVGGPEVNVLFQPAPFIPEGTNAVELTKRFPGDPESLVEAAMVLYWVHRAHRRGIPLIFMCHQHMRQFAGIACARFTEFVLREALTTFNGDLFIDTVWGIGSYWRAALSGARSAVRLRVEAGAAVVSNEGARDLEGVPVDLTLENGLETTVLVDLPAGGSARVTAQGVIA